MKPRRSESLLGDSFPYAGPSLNPKPFPFDALGPLLGPAAKALHEVVQAPDAACAQSVLAAAALAAQPLANVTLDGRAYPLSLFFVTIAASGERKSAVDRLVLQPFRERQDQLMKQYAQRRQQYEVDLKNWNSSTGGASPKRGAGRRMRPAQSPPERPKKPLLLVSEPTIEGLIQQFRDGYPSIGLFSDEAGGFLGGYSLRAERRMHATAALCKLWDGDPIDRVRKMEESTVIQGTRCSLHMMGQEILLQCLVHDQLSEGMGLLSRCLIAAPSPMVGKRSYQEVNLEEDETLRAFHLQCHLLLDHALGKHGEIPEALSFRKLSLSPAAKAVWVSYHDHNELRLGLEGSLKEVHRLGNKAPELVLRIAGVLALFEDPSVAEITLATVRRASRLVDWYLEEAIRLKSIVAPSVDMLGAEKLLEWLRQRSSPIAWIGEVYKHGPAMFRKAEEARRGLRKLEEHGLVRRIPDGAEVEGAWRAEVWELT